jgi:NAD/NADP transhydrogenase beta subunit
VRAGAQALCLLISPTTKRLRCVNAFYSTSLPLAEKVEVYIDVMIGAITTTGSVLAFLKLRGSVSLSVVLTRIGRTPVAFVCEAGVRA